MRSIQLEIGALEPLTSEHADEMFHVLSDPAIYPFENKPPESPEWLRTRYAFLEQRCSPEGGEKWLNWVIRLKNGGLAGFTQATVYADGTAQIAYVLHSRHWGKGIARRAVQAMIGELAREFGVRRLVAVLKAANERSLRLLERLDFREADTAMDKRFRDTPDERVMQRQAMLQRENEE